VSVTFEKLTSHTLRGRIAEKLRHAILDGSLTAGMRLVERQLAMQFGASLTAVREALIELESEGFITKKPNSGTVVTRLSPADVRKIFAVRRVLEALAIEEVCRIASDDEIRMLEKIYVQMVDAAHARDAKLFNRRDLEFHQLLWKLSKNEYLEAALRRAVVPHFAFTAILVAGRDPLDLFREAYTHLPVLEAIRTRDAGAARKAFGTALDSWLASSQAELARRPDGNSNAS
jgi:DNA-binding GntR family transcriptional regulator